MKQNVREGNVGEVILIIMIEIECVCGFFMHDQLIVHEIETIRFGFEGMIDHIFH